MVQQLSLFSQINPTELSLVKASLSSLTGQSHPQKYQHFVLICKPCVILQFEPNSTKQQFEQYKIQLKTNIPAAPTGSEPSESIVEKVIKESKEWALQVYDIPTFATQQHNTSNNSGGGGGGGGGTSGNGSGGSSSKKSKININSQTFSESIINVSKDETIETVLKPLGYEIQTPYKVEGERFHYGNITIELFQVLVLVDGKWQKLTTSTAMKCFINVAKLTDLENSSRSIQELNSLKIELQGLVELGVPDKNHMDSRIGFTR
ncbi:hypothetical protein WICPIJ_008840 [Wickerhamomyces pijperi]|uniref:Mediator of RNA polymerase II transcription subunit 18 n=1 Tax=Wickerhamomyces pijperi TaxID=599730 RepID=A0A9P8THB3_WICPI|nr:hypothetical protein WICPIJ_008840 [Wickerhamomyces pijperi]